MTPDWLDQPVLDIPIAVVDVETTGLKVDEGERVIEVAVLRQMPGARPEILNELVNPQRRIQPKAQAVHGIAERDLAGKPAFADIAEQVAEALRDAIVVAHNAPFDVSFLSMEFAIARHAPPQSPVLDTLQLSRQYLNFSRNGLQALATAFRVRRGTAHRATGDVLTTWEVFRKLAGHMATLGYTTGRHLIDAQQQQTHFVVPEPLYLPPALHKAMITQRRIVISYLSGGAIHDLLIDPLWANGETLSAFVVDAGEQRQFDITGIVDTRWPGGA